MDRIFDKIYVKTSPGWVWIAILLMGMNLAANGQIDSSRVGWIPVSNVVGITHVDGGYNFTGKAFLKEGADEILKLGSRCIKVWFNHLPEKYPFNSHWPGNTDTLSYMALAGTPYFKELFNMPFSVYSLEMTDANLQFNWRDGISRKEFKLIAAEYYTFTKYLLFTYKNSGKTFVFQNWESDGALDTKNHSAGETRIAIQGMIDWTNARQEGVDSARRECNFKDVLVANAFEFNMVLDDWTPPPYTIDKVVPFTHTDLYSYSSYSSRQLNKLNTITARLKYIESKIPPSKMYGKHNLMIGEFGYEERRYPYKTIVNDSTGNAQLFSVKSQLSYLLNWGVVYIFYWQLYCNESLDKSKKAIPVHDNMQYKGYWLRRADGSYSPVYFYFQQLFKENKRVKTYIPFNRLE